MNKPKHGKLYRIVAMPSQDYVCSGSAGHYVNIVHLPGPCHWGLRFVNWQEGINFLEHVSSGQAWGKRWWTFSFPNHTHDFVPVTYGPSKNALDGKWPKKVGVPCSK